MKKTASVLFYIVLYLLAIVGFAALAYAGLDYLPLSEGLPTDAKVVERLQSPDKRYQVVLFNRNGGPRSPYCVDNLSVSPVGTSDTDAFDNYTVTTTGCQGVTSIVWANRNTVQVKLDLKKGNENSDTDLKGSTRDNHIAIDYGMREPP